jgi:hypothetical protein
MADSHEDSQGGSKDDDAIQKLIVRLHIPCVYTLWLHDLLGTSRRQPSCIYGR